MKKEDIVKNLTDEEMVTLVKNSINTNFYEIQEISKMVRLYKGRVCAMNVVVKDKENDHVTNLTVVFDKDKVETQTLYTGVLEKTMVVGLKADYQKLLNEKFTFEEEQKDTL